MRTETQRLLTDTYAVHARSEGVLQRLAEELPQAVATYGVDLPPVAQTDLYCVAFATGTGSSSRAVVAEWRRENWMLHVEQLPPDEDLGAEGVVVRTAAPAPAEWRDAVSSALIAWASERYQDMEAATELEATAAHLATVAEHLLDFARQCSQLSQLDDRAWTLARVLRRHASELHSLVPAIEAEVKTLLRIQETSAEESSVFGDEGDVFLQWPDGCMVQEHLLSELDAVAASSHAVLLLETSRVGLEETDRLLAILCEEDRQRSDQALNVVVYWLGVITLGLGVVTLWDKYQTDQVFGLPVETAASIAGGLAVLLVSLFVAAVVRHGLVLRGPRRLMRRTLETAVRTARVGQEGARMLLSPVFPIRASESWFRGVEQERIILARSILTARELVVGIPARVEDLRELDEEAEVVLGLLWDSIMVRSTTSRLRQSDEIHVGAAHAMDGLWAEALVSVSFHGLWYSLPRPLPPQLWVALLLAGRSANTLAAPPSELAWARPWCWKDVEGGDRQEVRAELRRAVLQLVRQRWTKAHSTPCLLGDADLWGLVSGREPEAADMPPAPGGGDWEDLMEEVVSVNDSMQDLLEELRPLRSLGALGGDQA